MVCYKYEKGVKSMMTLSLEWKEMTLRHFAERVNTVKHETTYAKYSAAGSFTN